MCGWSSVLRHARYPRSLGKVCCIAPCSSNTYPVKSTVLLAWAAESDLDSPVQSSRCHMLLVLWLTEILAKLMNGLDDPGECLEDNDSTTCWSTMGDRWLYHRSCWMRCAISGPQLQELYKLLCILLQSLSEWKEWSGKNLWFLTHLNPKNQKAKAQRASATKSTASSYWIVKS